MWAVLLRLWKENSTAFDGNFAEVRIIWISQVEFHENVMKRFLSAPL